TWNYQLQVDFALGDTLGVFALGQYIGEVEQEIDGVAASFTLLTAGGRARPCLRGTPASPDRRRPWSQRSGAG
ncbi:MAG: hypothetical protein ACI9U2_004873, partial [Bradymonadia bacterium]